MCFSLSSLHRNCFGFMLCFLNNGKLYPFGMVFVWYPHVMSYPTVRCANLNIHLFTYYYYHLQYLLCALYIPYLAYYYSDPVCHLIKPLKLNYFLSFS